MLQSYEIVHYFLYTELNSIDDSGDYTEFNYDIFNHSFIALVEQAVRKFYEGRSCFLPTVSTSQAEELYNTIVSAFIEQGIDHNNVILLTGDRCVRDYDSSCILIGQLHDSLHKISYVDWTALSHMLLDTELKLVSDITESICVPVPWNSVPWFDRYLTWLLTEFDRSSTYDTTQLSTIYK